MPIIATCSTCGHQYTISSKLAGKKLKCKQCGGIVEVPSREPAPAAPSEDDGLLAIPHRDKPLQLDTEYETAPPAPVREAAPPPARRVTAAPVVQYRSKQYDEPSPERLKAGRTCIILAVLGYIFSACIGVAALFLTVGAAAMAKGGPAAPGGGPMAGFAAIAGVLVGVIFFLFVAISTTYLVCGINIRKGGYVSVIVALIVASLHELLSLLNFGLGLAAMASEKGSPNVISLGISFLWVAGLAQLIVYLVKILREPR